MFFRSLLTKVTVVFSWNSALGDSERQCHVEECYNCGQLSQGYGKIGSHIGNASNMMESQAKATQEGIVEDLKRHRDLLVSLMQLLQRHEYSRQDARAEMVYRRLAANDAKLKALKAVPTSGASATSGSAINENPNDNEALIETITSAIQAVSANASRQD